MPALLPFRRIHLIIVLRRNEDEGVHPKAVALLPHLRVPCLLHGGRHLH